MMRTRRRRTHCTDSIDTIDSEVKFVEMDIKRHKWV